MEPGTKHLEAGTAPSQVIPELRNGDSHCLECRHKDQAGGIPRNSEGEDIALSYTTGHEAGANVTDRSCLRPEPTHRATSI